MTRISIITAMAVLFLLPPLYTITAEEGEVVTAKADTAMKPTGMDTTKTKTDREWMNTIWKRISVLTAAADTAPQARTDGTQEPAPTLGVRGFDFEAEPYYKEETARPEDQEIREAIALLRANIAEALYLIGECYVRLREEENARIVYEQLRKEHPESVWTKKIQEEMQPLRKGTPEK